MKPINIIKKLNESDASSDEKKKQRVENAFKKVQKYWPEIKSEDDLDDCLEAFLEAKYNHIDVFDEVYNSIYNGDINYDYDQLPKLNEVVLSYCRAVYSAYYNNK